MDQQTNRHCLPEFEIPVLGKSTACLIIGSEKIELSIKAGFLQPRNIETKSIVRDSPDSLTMTFEDIQFTPLAWLKNLQIKLTNNTATIDGEGCSIFTNPNCSPFPRSIFPITLPTFINLIEHIPTHLIREPKVMVPEVIEPEVIEPEVIEPELETQSRLKRPINPSYKFFEYQQPYHLLNVKYGPKKQRRKKKR